MALALLVLVGHACVLPGAAHGEREEAGRRSSPQPGDERESTAHVSSCEASVVRPAPLATGQELVVPAGQAALLPALGPTTLERSRTFAHPYVLLHPPLRI
jgi:hypothetical protein